MDISIYITVTIASASLGLDQVAVFWYAFDTKRPAPMMGDV